MFDIIDELENNICPACLQNHNKLGMEYNGCCSQECMNCFLKSNTIQNVPQNENYVNEYVLKIKHKAKYVMEWCCIMFYSVPFDPKYTQYYPIHKNMFDNLVDGLDITNYVVKSLDYSYYENKKNCKKWFVYPDTATIVKRI